jgi:hypothetical protein
MSRKFSVTENRFASDAEALAQRHLAEADARTRTGRTPEALEILTQYVEWCLKGAGEPFDDADRRALHIMQDVRESLARSSEGPGTRTGP